MGRDSILEIYERQALGYDRDRSRSLMERAWMDRFLAHVGPEGTVLDLGCGMGEPLAGYLLHHGRRVVGVDGSPKMIELCRSRFPEAEWHVGDMRELDLPRRFDGILAWHSLFHLGKEDQRGMFRRLARHARPGAPLMFTSGPEEGEAVGVCCGEPLYHASLGPEEYERRLVENGFAVRDFLAEDPECGQSTVWLATYDDPVSPAVDDPQGDVADGTARRR